MFRQLVTNLPYSPGLLSQISFYKRRLKQEELTRRLGLIFTALAVVVQASVLISPPRTSLATSTNDIIYGGGTKEQILMAFRQDRDHLGRGGIQAIYNRFGIGDWELSWAQEVTIRSYASENYWSIGRESRFSSNIEHAVEVPGGPTVFIKPLHAWDSGPYSEYKALHGRNRDGREFWILMDCGNVVMRGPEDPLNPDLQIEKRAKSPASALVKRGDIIEYEILYRNVGPGTAAFATVNDNVPRYTEFVSVDGAPGTKWEYNNGLLKLYNDNPYNSLGPTPGYWNRATMKLRVTNDAPNGQRICNTVSLTALNAPNPANSDPNAACKTVVVEEKPIFGCSSLAWVFDKKSDRKGTFTVRGFARNAQIQRYTIQPGKDLKPIIIETGNGRATAKFEYPKEGKTFDAKATVTTNKGTSDNGSCIAKITRTPNQPRIVHDKLVENTTQHIEDANNTVAAPGDTLVYTLVTENVSDVEAEDFVPPAEYIGDILEYADLVSVGDADYNKEEKTLRWKAMDLDANEKVRKTFTVKIKNPLPQTPVSASDPTSYDFIMSNAYGDKEVTVKLPKPPGKTIETVSTTLPNTGPGENLAVVIFLVVIVSYFYARNRLVNKELGLIKKEFSGGVA